MYLFEICIRLILKIIIFFLFYPFTFLLSDANIVLENSCENSHSRDLLNIKRAVLRFGAD